MVQSTLNKNREKRQEGSSELCRNICDEPNPFSDSGTFDERIGGQNLLNLEDNTKVSKRISNPPALLHLKKDRSIESKRS
jgi:uncharacterized lipoprotein NlpE involved in copper resistance